MDITRLISNREGLPNEKPIGPGFSPAPLLVLSFSGTPVKEFLARHVLQPEGFHVASPQKTPHGNNRAYRFSTITPFIHTDRAFPAAQDNEQSFDYLRDEIASMPNLRAIIALGITAYHSVMHTCQLPITHLGCRPGRLRTLPDGLILAQASHIPAVLLHNKSDLPARLHPLRQVLSLLRKSI